MYAHEYQMVNPLCMDEIKYSYPGTCIGLAVMVNNVETLMYVLIEFIFCLGIPKTPTREAPEEMDHAIFHSHIRII